MINWLRKLFAPRWIVRNNCNSDNTINLPTVAGHYRVIISGDSETDGPHVYYSYPDYETWAWFEPGDPGDGYDGTFTGTHDEETDMVFAWCGPFIVPKRG